jgi:hypothetical protein
VPLLRFGHQLRCTLALLTLISLLAEFAVRHRRRGFFPRS